jgi:DNA-binding response OmpR family regulator
MRTVLLVDDSPVARRVLARRLMSDGFHVREESSAAEANGADASALSCAILDLELVDGKGTDLAASLRGRRASLPIAFFTAGAPSSLLEAALKLGPVFQKPDVDAIIAWAKRAGQPPPTK